MDVITGQIVKNLVASEPVTISQIQDLGSMISVKFTGVNSNVSINKIITCTAFEKLEVLTEQGVFNFTGDAKKFGLFAVNCSIVDPLPHQVEAVYKFLLPLPKIRFLLADDTGAGKSLQCWII